jgi:hypothetical protein
MKFDMSAAWNEATRLLSANRQVLLVVAGVFFFLPSVVYTLVFNSQMAGFEAAQSGDPDFGAMFQAMLGLFREYWWVMLLTTLVQWLGALSLIALLADRGRPTVGEAIRTGGKLLLPYIGTQLLFACLTGLLILLPVAIGSRGSVVAGTLVGLLAAVVWLYLFVKFMLVAPVVAVERQTNPVAALGRSWRLTKGNSLRLFAFVFLLAVAFIVVASVAGIASGLLLALAGSEVALVGDAIVSGAVEAGFSVLFLAALVAIHRQLAGNGLESPAETFS